MTTGAVPHKFVPYVTNQRVGGENWCGHWVGSGVCGRKADDPCHRMATGGPNKHKDRVASWAASAVVVLLLVALAAVLAACSDSSPNGEVCEAVGKVRQPSGVDRQVFVFTAEVYEKHAAAATGDLRDVLYRVGSDYREAGAAMDEFDGARMEEVGGRLTVDLARVEQICG